MASIISAGTTSGTSLNLSGDTSGVLQLATNGSTTAMTINTSQNVGIGTASPASLLHISGGALRGSNAADTLQLIGGVSGTANNIQVRGASHPSTPNIVTFDTNSTERMRIDSVGRVGIGNSSPSALLHVTNNSNTYAGGILIGSAGVASGYISTTDNLYIKPNTTANTASGVVVVQDFSNANKITLSSVNGTIGLGGANAASTGVGITFPATQSASSDANTLDDYEEGTYTVTFTPSSSGSITLGSNTFAYTKIGRIVTVTGYAEVSSVSSPTGAYLKISLPFTIANADSAYASGSIAFNVLGSSKAGNIGWVNLASNNAEAHIYDGSLNSVASGAFASYMASGTNCRLSITYFTS